MKEIKVDFLIFFKNMKNLSINKKYLLLVLVTMGLSNIVALANPLLYGKVINAIVDQDLKQIGRNLICMIVVFVLSIVIEYINSLFMIQMTMDIEKKAKNKIFTAIMSTPYKKYMKSDKGTLINTLEEDSSVFSNLLFNNISFITDIILLFISFGFMLITCPLLTAVLFITFPISGGIYLFSGKKVKRNEEKYKTAHDLYLSFLTESIYGWKTLKLFGKEQGRTNDFREKTNQLYELEVNKNMIQIKSSIIINILTFLANNMNLLLGIYLIFRGQLTLGMFTAFTSYSANFKSALLSVAQMSSVVQETVVSLERINDISNYFVMCEDSMGKASKLDKIEKIEKIKIEDLSYSVSEDNTVFEHANIEFESNKIYLIKGESGSGKSTILNILSGLLNDYTGKIWLNDKLHSQVDEGEIRRHVSYITQENYVFSMSVKENITLYKDIAIESVKRACEKLNIRNAIRKLPNDYETILNRSGNDLSGGEKQRICIARSLVEKPEIYLFDEVTSAIDQTNTKQLTEIMELLAEKAIVIMTTHDDLKFNIPVKEIYIRDKKFVEKYA